MRFLLFLFTGVAMAAPCTSADKICVERMPLRAGRYIQIFRSYSLQQTAHSIERAFILVHSTLRNGDDYFKPAVAAASEAGRLDKTMVIAPHFKAMTATGILLQRLEGRRAGARLAHRFVHRAGR